MMARLTWLPLQELYLTEVTVILLRSFPMSVDRTWTRRAEDETLGRTLCSRAGMRAVIGKGINERFDG